MPQRYGVRARRGYPSWAGRVPILAAGPSPESHHPDVAQPRSIGYHVIDEPGDAEVVGVLVPVCARGARARARRGGRVRERAVRRGAKPRAAQARAGRIRAALIARAARATIRTWP